MALETRFPRKKIESKGVRARAPCSTFGWSLSPSLYHSAQAGCLFPSPKACCSQKATGEGFPRAHVTPLAVGSQRSRQRFLCWPVLPCHERQGFSAVASRASSQRLQGGLCNGWLLKIEKTKVCIYFNQIKTAKGGKGVGGWGGEDHVTGGRGLCHVTDYRLTAQDCDASVLPASSAKNPFGGFWSPRLSPHSDQHNVTSWKASH